MSKRDQLLLNMLMRRIDAGDVTIEDIKDERFKKAAIEILESRKE